jgi:two-component system, cell cycle sensor histidine kinase and response regulator CckA
VLLSVTDDGSGMDDATLSRIFEPFFTTKGVGKGTGLGLATVYGIVKQNSGFIDVRSELGKGSSFSVLLPRHAGDAIEPRQKEELEAPRRGSETILVVEDEQVILNMTVTMLTTLGYRVLATSSPERAIELAGETRDSIDLLVTDVVMPEMNGRELADRLRARRPSLKHLYVSGYAADAISRYGIAAEGAHFLQKPFTKRDLGAKVRATLDG